MERPSVLELAVPAVYDSWGSLRFLPMGRADPTAQRQAHRVSVARWYPTGPATLLLERTSTGVRASAWGAAKLDALAQAPELLGLHDRVPQLTGHPLVERLSRELAGVHLIRQPTLTHGLVQTLLQQLIPWVEAASASRGLTELSGQRAPGPLGHLLPPSSAWLVRLPTHEYQRCGVGSRKANTIREVARLRGRVDQWVRHSVEAFCRQLQTVPGVGRWTVPHCLGFHYGHPDALPIGDYGFPHLVSRSLEQKDRSDDAEMLKLMQPWRGQRFRLLRWMMAANLEAPRYGPRVELRWRRQRE